MKKRNSLDSLVPAPWIGPVTVLASMGLAFFLYRWTAAPGLTWANHGADGGELVATALVNGVPHPPGYPLYIMLLQLWLALGRMWVPLAEPARLGTLLSVICAVGSVGVTVVVAAQLLALAEIQPGLWGRRHWRWCWAAIAGGAWACAPLPWGQAIITEVYALHALLVALLGWAVLVKRSQPLYLVPIVALGIANHLTFVLLLPGVLYMAWSEQIYQRKGADGAGMRQALSALTQASGVLVLAVLLGALFYIRIPLVAGQPPPINWGYPDNWAGFWWLVSAAAYRGYLFNVPTGSIFSRVAVWAYTLTVQFTAVGLGLALAGLAHLDQAAPRLRNFTLLWTVPLSVYSISYYTRDSEIYLLPAIWLLALWLAVGVSVSVRWLRQQWPHHAFVWARTVAVLMGLALLVLVMLRIPIMSLRNDSEAQQFLAGAIAAVEPGSLLVSSADTETFALWYGAWGSGELLEMNPEPILVNYALLQFPWYRRLLVDLYPDVPGMGGTWEELLAANAGQRPIYFSERLSIVPERALTPVGPLWRYVE